MGPVPGTQEALNRARRLAVMALVSALAYGLAVDDATAQGTTVTLTLAPTSLSEDNAVATEVTVTATLSSMRTSSTVITLSLAGTATRGTDYLVSSTLPRITIAANQTEASVIVVFTPVDDTFWEGGESIEVNGQAGSSVAVQGATLPLGDNENRPSISLFWSPSYTFSDLRIPEESATPVSYTLHAELSSGATLETDTPITLSLETNGVAGTDYTVTDPLPTITLGAGKTTESVVIVLTSIDNSDDGPHQFFTVSGTANDHRGQAFDVSETPRIILIIDDEERQEAVYITLSVDPEVVREQELVQNGGKDVTVTARLSGGGPLVSPVVVNLDLYSECGVLADTNLPDLTIPAGNSLSGQQTVRLQGVTNPSISQECIDFISSSSSSYSGGSASIFIVPSAPPAIQSVRVLENSASSAPPSDIGSEGDSIRFYFNFNRSFRVNGIGNNRARVTLTFQLGDETRTAQCSGTASYGQMICSYTVAAGDRDLDGLSLASNALTIVGSTVDYYDESISFTVNTTIPSDYLQSGSHFMVHGTPRSFELLASIESLQEGVGPTEITVTATQIAGREGTVDILIPIVFGKGTAEEADYSVSSGPHVITIEDGELSGSTTFTFTAEDDRLLEERTEIVRIEGRDEYPSFVVGTGLALIDSTTIQLSASPLLIQENGGPQTVMVTAELGDPNDQTRPLPTMVSLTLSGSAGSGDYSVAEDLIVTIPAYQGSGTATLTFTPVNDQLFEGDETIVIIGSTDLLAVLGTPTITLRDDDTDPAVILEVSDPIILESETSATDVTVSARLDSGEPVRQVDTVVTLSLTGTATLGSSGDFTAAWAPQTRQITIPQGQRDGQSTVTLTLRPRQDSLAEGDETIVVEGTATGDLVVQVATITLVDDEVPGLALVPTVLEVTEGESARYTVALTFQPTEPVVVTMTTDLQDTDLSVSTTRLQFEPNLWNQPQSVNVTAERDADTVADDSVILVHEATGGAYDGVTSSVTVTIEEADVPIVTLPGLSVAGGSHREDQGPIDFTVTLSPASLDTVTVQYATSSGSATEGTDYTGAQGTLTFDGGDTTETVSVILRDDLLDEDSEDFTLTLSTPTNATLTTATATGTITDNDSEPDVQLDTTSVTVDEGEIASFDVRLGAASGRTVTVDFATSSGTARQGTDFTAATGTLTFGPGQPLSQTINVATTDDPLDEADEEQFTLTLRNARNASLGTAAATGTITDNDALTAEVSADAENVVEGNNATFTVRVEGGTSTAPVQVLYTVTGTAEAGVDYTAPSGTLTIGTGASTGTITIRTLRDELTDAGETLVVALSEATTDGRTVTVNPSASVETAIADLGTVTVSVMATGTNVPEGATAEFEVELSDTVSDNVTVTWATADVTATAGEDYTTGNGSLTFVAGERSKTVSVSTINDRIDEPLESFEVRLTGQGLPSGVVLGMSRVRVMIGDDDTRGVTLSRRSVRILEDSSGTYGVALTSQPTNLVTVTPTVTGDSDITVNPGSLTFTTTDWMDDKTFTVRAASDLDSVDDEATVTHTVGGGDYANVAVGSVAVMVDDDEAPATMVVLTVDPPRVSEDAGETTVTVTATLGGSLPAGAQVEVTVSNGTATAPADYTANPNTLTVTIPAGQSSAEETFTLRPVLEPDNVAVECDETVTIRGRETSGANPPLTVVPAILILRDPASDPLQCTPVNPRPPGPIGPITPTGPSSPLTPPGPGDDGSGTGAGGGNGGGTLRSDAMELLPPTPGKVAIWTDQLGYSFGQQVQLYRSLDPMGDDNEYSFFYYLENIGTGKRRYFAPGIRTTTLRNEVIDHFGSGEAAYEIVPIPSVHQEMIWAGAVSEPGLWHFVAELRNPDATQRVKSVYAKFVVSSNSTKVLGADGSATEISMDQTWTADTIYELRQQVFVNDGATLTIEAGTLIRSSGVNAAVVVESGGRIMVQGRREAPVVMTCDEPVGQREAGCWGGLILLGNAPAADADGVVPDLVPETRAEFGGDDENDSSGTLRYLRVEFAGGGTSADGRPAGIGLFGVGAGTVIDHVQAHASLDDGILFRGGTAHCGYCVASGARSDSLEWAQGWLGTAQHVYLQQGPQGDAGIEASGATAASGLQATARPALYNVTLVGGGTLGTDASSGDGVELGGAAELTAANVVVTGFGGFALDAGTEAEALFVDSTSTLRNAILHGNGNREGEAQIDGDIGSYVDFMDIDPELRNARYEANPDPRPMHGSSALEVGAAATPPSDGTFSRQTQFVGAFGAGNWLEEWTFFGPESDYAIPDESEDDP